MEEFRTEKRALISALIVGLITHVVVFVGSQASGWRSLLESWTHNSLGNFLGLWIFVIALSILPYAIIGIAGLRPRTSMPPEVLIFFSVCISAIDIGFFMNNDNDTAAIWAVIAPIVVFTPISLLAVLFGYLLQSKGGT
ncbi:MAG: hypothetical protein HYX63_12930 [Gammaproteobacteria bacterium]|nr:hypothetical protein [Gammaproteobacteria bacterium]